MLLGAKDENVKGVAIWRSFKSERAAELSDENRLRLISSHAPPPHPSCDQKSDKAVLRETTVHLRRVGWWMLFCFFGRPPRDRVTHAVVDCAPLCTEQELPSFAAC